eukprot:jgi/Tetstr1/422356/TSEL_013197.t1
MASASTFHTAAGPDDASWKGFMLQSGSPEPPPAPRGPPLRYYLTTVSADRSSNVSDGVKLNGPLTTARLCEASSTANQAAQGVYVFTSLAEAQDETDLGFDAAYVCSCDLSQLEEAGFRVAGGGLIQLYTRPTAVSRMSSSSVTGLGSAVAQQAIAGTERQRSERAVPAALKHHFDTAFDAFYPIDGVTGLPYMDAEIPGYTKGHIIKRFKELAATATGLAYDIIPGAPTDYVLRKQIQKAARSRRRNWPLSKKWPERKTRVIQLWAATLWGRYYTESVTKGTTAVPPPYLTVEEEQAALLNSAGRQKKQAQQARAAASRPAPSYKPLSRGAQMAAAVMNSIPAEVAAGSKGQSAPEPAAGIAPQAGGRKRPAAAEPAGRRGGARRGR